jgi:hypothetical protein
VLGPYAKSLLTFVLILVVIGIALRRVADKLFPLVNRIAGVFTVITMVLVLLFYGKVILNASGECAIVAQRLFLCGMTLIAYTVGCGLKQEQRSNTALGMGTLKY